jgi:hypothetical protein
VGRGLKVAVLTTENNAGALAALAHVEVLGPKDGLEDVARNLFGALRAVDDVEVDLILR